MKKLLYLGIVLMLGSCGPNREEIKEEGPNRAEIKEEERIRMEVIEELEEEKILKEEKRIEEERRVEEEKRLEEEERINRLKSSTIKIGNLEVMTEDIGVMNWEDAKKACEALGDGWRLPTRDELNLLYENKSLKVKKGDFANTSFWSSTEADSNLAWAHYFARGHLVCGNKLLVSGFRAVRAF